MYCPKCRENMEQVTCNEVTIDRCVACRGLWFDSGEAEALSESWMAEYVDTGDPQRGQVMDDIDTVDCPRCGKEMRRFFDISESRLQFEECDEHGKFFDAGEFTAWITARYL